MILRTEFYSRLFLPTSRVARAPPPADSCRCRRERPPLVRGRRCRREPPRSCAVVDVGASVPARARLSMWARASPLVRAGSKVNPEQKCYPKSSSQIPTADLLPTQASAFFCCPSESLLIFSHNSILLKRIRRRTSSPDPNTVSKMPTQTLAIFTCAAFTPIDIK